MDCLITIKTIKPHFLDFILWQTKRKNQTIKPPLFFAFIFEKLKNPGYFL
ncbi:hypothetical protein A608_0197 [Helicobacter pylori CCHI 33]|nr:hypothetical protein A608_0197 [Helicobacter pylori CCHI 33]